MMTELQQARAEAATLRRAAKLAADRMAAIHVCSTTVVRMLEPLRTVPVVGDAWLVALRWDCRVGDYLAEVEAALAETRRTRTTPPPVMTLRPV